MTSASSAASVLRPEGSPAVRTGRSEHEPSPEAGPSSQSPQVRIHRRAKPSPSQTPAPALIGLTSPQRPPGDAVDAAQGVGLSAHAGDPETSPSREREPQRPDEGATPAPTLLERERKHAPPVHAMQPLDTLQQRHPRVGAPSSQGAASPTAASILGEVTAQIEQGGAALRFLVHGPTRLPVSSTDQAGVIALRHLVEAFDRRHPSAREPQVRKAQARRLERLLDVYRNNTPAGIFHNDVERTALTLQALLELDTEPDALESALSQAYVRDMLRQLLSSGMGYTLSWFLGNLTAYQLQRDHPEVSATARTLVAALVIGLGSRVARRLIAGAEWAPVWTSAVMTDAGGRVRPFSQTHRGAAMSSAAYGAFMVSLLAISLGTADPQATHDPQRSAERAMARQQYRMFWNFLATGGVGCWRFFSIPEREYQFLTAKDRPGDRPGVRREVLAASVRRLNDGSMIKDAVAYTAWDPMRGLFELPARAAYQRVKNWTLSGIAGSSNAPEWLRAPARHHLAAARGARDAKEAERDKALSDGASRQGHTVSSFFKDVHAAISLAGVASMASFVRALATDYPEHSKLINGLADGALVFAWGVAMHAADLSSLENPSIASEARFRALRRTLEMAPARADASPPAVDAVAPRPLQPPAVAAARPAPAAGHREGAEVRVVIDDASSQDGDGSGHG